MVDGSWPAQGAGAPASIYETASNQRAVSISFEGRIVDDARSWTFALARRGARASRHVVALAVLVIAIPAGAIGAQAAHGRADTLRVDGSNGVMPLAAALATAFQREHPLTVVVMGGGMGGGERLAALRARRIDIALASHGLDTAALRRDSLVPHRVATTAVVLGVNAGAPASALTSAQACAIFTGPAPSWSDVTGRRESPPLVVVAREESEVDMEVLRREIACLGTLPMAAHVRIAADTDAMRRALLEAAGAVGVTTATVVRQESGRLRALTLDGVAPTTDAVARGDYRLVRDSYFVTRAAASPATARFLGWIRSAAGERVLAANGAVSAARSPAQR
jgi:phosphate transport system substrate-binding protein